MRTFASPLKNKATLTKSSGEVAEWSIAAVLKPLYREVPGVRIPVSPKEIVILVKSRFYENFFCSFSKMKNRKVGADLFFRREMVNFKNA